MTRDTRHTRHPLCYCLLALSVLCVLLAAPADASEDSDATTSTRNEVHWRGDELVAPLPSDPGIRAAAIAEARRRNADRLPKGQGTPVYGVAGTRVEPGRSVGGASRRAVKRSNDSRRDVATMRSRLKYPSAGAPRGGASLLRGTTQPQMITGSVFTPSSGTSFDAIDDTGIDPPSPDIAVGPNEVVVTANDVISAYDRCGNLLDTWNLEDFGGPEGWTDYGARVIYDQWDNRWVLAYTSYNLATNQGRYTLVISDTYDFTDGQYWYDNGFSFQFPDGVFLAADGDFVYVTFNMFDLPGFGFNHTAINVWTKSEVYTAGPAGVTHYALATNPEDGSTRVGIRPAIMHTWGGTTYFLNTRHDGGDFLTMSTFSGAGPILNFTIPLGFSYFPPTNYQQPDGSYLRTGDARITDLVYKSGKLYGTHTEDIGGIPTVFLQQFDVGTTAFDTETSVVGAYGSVDIDFNDGLTLTYNFWTGSTFAGTRTAPIASADAFPSTVYIVADGLDDFTRTGAGTINAPYAWGNSTGTALDPTDNRTFWTAGAYASNDPTPSWATKVKTVSNFDAGNLVIHPPADNASTGYEGGPFSQDNFAFDLENTGETAVHWTVSGVPTWLAASATSGVISPGDTQPVTFFLTGVAYTETPAWNFNDLQFTNCSGGGGGTEQVRLIVAQPGECPGAAVFAGPFLGASNGAFVTTNDVRGAYITALRDAQLCGIGINLDITTYQWLTARVYEATGNTRGSLIYANTLTLIDIGTHMRYVPVEVYLDACQDYDIEVEFYNNGDMSYWDPGIITPPVDPGRIVRFRSGEINGVPDPNLPELALVFQPLPVQGKTDLFLVPYDSNQSYFGRSVGVYMTALKTVQLTGVAFEADLVPGTQLRARLYDAAGTTRQDLLAEGFAVVAGSGQQYHIVPLDALMAAGAGYDVEVTYENTGDYPAGIDGGELPDTTSGGVALVLAGEVGGVTPSRVPKLGLCWIDKDLGVPFDLRPDLPYPPPVTVGWGVDNGVYITSDVDQELLSFSVYADIPQGSAIVATVFEATGTTRGALVSNTQFASDESGYRWHDIPVSATLQAGADYNLHIECSTINGQRYWSPSPPLPYTAYGTVTVNACEQTDGTPIDQMNEFRMHTLCGDVGPSAVPAAAVPVPFYLAAPAPNPASGSVRLSYSIDSEGLVEMAMYDVAGRKVADVLRRTNAVPGPGSVSFDTSRLPSGVYFVRLTSPQGIVARKLVVNH